MFCSIIQRMEKFMSKSKETIMAEIRGITLNHGVTNNELNKKLSDFYDEKVAPLNTEIVNLKNVQDDIADEVETLIDQLSNEDTDGALATANIINEKLTGDAAPTSGSGDAGAVDSGDSQSPSAEDTVKGAIDEPKDGSE